MTRRIAEHEDGDLEITENEYGIFVTVYNQGGYDCTSTSVSEILHSLTGEQRKKIFAEFCGHCGSNNPNCHCWNDE